MKRSERALGAWALALTLLWAHAAGAAEQLPALDIELHSHLFMKPALGWLFRGSFDEGLEADSWDDRLSSKANAESLERSNDGIVVVALFAHPLYAGDMRQAVREQIAEAERFVASHAGWALARNAADARRMLLAGKRVLVLSLEGAAGVLESEQDLHEFIDEKGIAIVTPLHLVDDRYGGAAALGGFQYVGNPLGVVDRLLDPPSGPTETNRRSLTPLGKRLIVELLARGVWIDLTHAPDGAVAAMLPMLEQAGQPLLYTHTYPRATRPLERGISDAMLSRVARSHGMIGLLPSEDAFDAELLEEPPCPKGCDPAHCRHGAHAIAALYRHMAAVIDARAIAVGADFNGGMRHLRASCGTGTSLDAEPGLYQLGQEGELWRALSTLGTPVPSARARMSYFLDSWSRVRAVDVADSELPPLPARADVEGPSLSLRVGVGMGSTAPEAAPGVMAWLDGAVRKDSAMPLEAEPNVYFVHLQAELTKALEDDRVPYLDMRLAPVGVEAHDWLNHVAAEAVALQLARREPLDQTWVVRAAALRGVARMTPGWWKLPGAHATFVELTAQLLGYKHVRHGAGGLVNGEERPHLHALHLVEGGLRAGVAVEPEPGALLTLAGHALADLNLAWPTRTTMVQSDIELGGGVSLLFREQGIEPFFRADYVANRETGPEAWLLGAVRLRGGVMLTLF